MRHIAFIVAFLLTSCLQPKTASEAKAATCSDAGIVALDTACKQIVMAANESQKQVIVDACSALIDAQALTCGDKK